MNALLISSIVLAVFLSTLVFVKKQKSYSHFLLAGWFLFTAIHLSVLYLQTLNASKAYPYPWIIGPDLSMILIHAIWIFIYLLSYIRPDQKKTIVLWHLLPILGINLVLVKTYYLKSNSWKISSYQHALNGSGYIDKGLELSVLLVVIFAIGYLAASFWLLHKHRNTVRNIYSTLTGVDLKWLNIFLISVSAVIVLNTLLDWSRNYFSFMPSDLGMNIGYMSILAGLMYVGFYGIRQTSIFSSGESVDLAEMRDPPELLPQDNENVSEITQDTLDHDFEELIQFMKTKKPFLDMDLNLQSLSMQTRFKTRYLSQLINKKAGQNFFDFINHYRIEEFKSRVKQEEFRNFTLLAVAFDCGFNSKATFNRVFKNHTGQTPSKFFTQSGINMRT